MLLYLALNSMPGTAFPIQLHTQNLYVNYIDLPPPVTGSGWILYVNFGLSLENSISSLKMGWQRLMYRAPLRRGQRPEIRAWGAVQEEEGRDNKRSRERGEETELPQWCPVLRNQENDKMVIYKKGSPIFFFTLWLRWKLLGMLTGFFPPKKGTTLTDCREIGDTKNMRKKKKKEKSYLQLLDCCQHCTGSLPLTTIALWGHHNGAQGLSPEAHPSGAGSWPQACTKGWVCRHTQHSSPERSTGNHSTRNNQDESHIPVLSSPERSWWMEGTAGKREESRMGGGGDVWPMGKIRKTVAGQVPEAGQVVHEGGGGASVSNACTRPCSELWLSWRPGGTAKALPPASLATVTK